MPDRPPREVMVRHRSWTDVVRLFPHGDFFRKSTDCGGTWEALGDGVIRLRWRQWGISYLVPATTPEDDGNGGVTASYECRAVLPRTLTVELRGGLGNQMFQYAHALALARRAEVELRVTWANYGRSFELHRFGIRMDADPDEPWEMFEDNGCYRREPEWASYTSISHSTAPHFRMAGYYQNETYFMPVADELRRIFRVRRRRPAGSDGRAVVAVHVRRGDFVGNGAHDICRPRYYQQAMRMMRGLVTAPLFVMVSEDPEWCRLHFQAREDLVILEKLGDAEAWETLAGGDAFILSNSTFGWWAAWLADRGPVLAPNQFLRGEDWPTCPESWITLPPEGYDEGAFATGMPSADVF